MLSLPSNNFVYISIQLFLPGEHIFVVVAVITNRVLDFLPVAFISIIN